jgi:hypothetical protein
MKTALDETGYTAALSEVETLKKKLKTLTLDEFTKNEKQIRKRLDLTLRQRFVPESVVTSVALYGDKEVPSHVHACMQPFMCVYAAESVCSM